MSPDDRAARAVGHDRAEEGVGPIEAPGPAVAPARPAWMPPGGSGPGHARAGDRPNRWRPHCLVEDAGDRPLTGRAVEEMLLDREVLACLRGGPLPGREAVAPLEDDMAVFYRAPAEDELANGQALRAALEKLLRVRAAAGAADLREEGPVGGYVNGLACGFGRGFARGLPGRRRRSTRRRTRTPGASFRFMSPAAVVYLSRCCFLDHSRNSSTPEPNLQRANRGDAPAAKT